MGHSEMLLAVAGLKDEEIKDQTTKLASGDWSPFPPAERQAFRFANRLTAEPWTVSAEEVHELVKTFGAARALDLIWYTGWSNYMTRIADAFQLPLEKVNIFAVK